MPLKITPVRKPGVGEILSLAAKYFVPLACLISVILYGYYRVESNNRRQIVCEQEKRSVALMKESISGELFNVIGDARLLATDRDIQDYLLDPDRRGYAKLSEYLLRFSRARNLYSQVRYIGNDGKEIIRVDAKSGKHVLCKRNNLQDKSQRYYVREGLRLGNREIYISPLDLNVEGGEIEIPYTPMLRIVTPVFGESGARSGMIVLNYRAQRMIDSIRRIGIGARGHALWLNEKGYFFIAPDTSLEWGFMFNEKSGSTFDASFPGTWESIQKEKVGQMQNMHGLFTFEKVNPIELALHGRVIEGISAPQRNNESNLGPWVLASHISEDSWYMITAQIRRSVWFAGAVILVLVAAASLVLARMRIHQILADDAEREAEELYRQLAKHIPNGAVYMYNMDYMLLLAEGREVADLGISSHIHEGVSLLDIFPEDSRDAIREGLGYALEGREHEMELPMHGRCLMLYMLPVSGEHGGERLALLMTQDISERKEMEEKLRDAATIDALTNIFNRRAFIEHLESACLSAKRYKQPLSVCLCDVDHFKTVNDTYGHRAGDEVLQRFGALLKQSLRETDIPGRYGGDEFAVIFPHTAAKEAADSLDRFRAALEEESFSSEDGRIFMVSGSFGVADYVEGVDGKQMLERADEALYDAKEAGRNSVKIRNSGGGNDGNSDA